MCVITMSYFPISESFGISSLGGLVVSVVSVSLDIRHRAIFYIGSIVLGWSIAYSTSQDYSTLRITNTPTFKYKISVRFLRLRAICDIYMISRQDGPILSGRIVGRVRYFFTNKTAGRYIERSTFRAPRRF